MRGVEKMILFVDLVSKSKGDFVGGEEEKFRLRELNR